MGDLTNPRAIKLKGILFLFLGLLAAAGVLIETRTWRHAVLLAVAVWAFCRFYYFAFYVIQHYVDPGFKFAGLWDFARYLFRQGSNTGRSSKD